MKILVINAGSSSLKYQLIDMDDETVLAKGNCERIGMQESRIKGQNYKGVKFEKEVRMHNHTEAFLFVTRALTQGEAAVIEDMKEISAVGHRVVQGGAKFNKSMLVTDYVLKGIEELSDLAPLHNPAHVQGINACRAVFGDEVPEVVVFDNAFHSTMPPEAYLFPIPYEYYEKYQIRRYGFHGTSHRYVSARWAELMGRDIVGTKLITCHLGNGCSITAIKDGKVIDTSMGLTPLDGFTMGTRSGSLDPSVIIYLQEKEGWTPQETDTILNKKSGLLGISGISSDDRDLEQAIAAGNERAKMASAIQRYQIRKFIGGYVAALEGVDGIVFTGGIGENSAVMRAEICDHLGYLGIHIDHAVNDETVHGKEGKISTDDSSAVVYVIPTNEELVIARDTKAIVEGTLK